MGETDSVTVSLSLLRCQSVLTSNQSLTPLLHVSDPVALCVSFHSVHPKALPLCREKHACMAVEHIFHKAQLTAPFCCLQEEAVHSAEATGTPVSHPIIDRIRACSSTPDLAADFFLCLLCPEASNRATAVNMRSHLYCKLQCLEADVAFFQRVIETEEASIRAA